jgi:hypothetical protein
VSAQQWREDVLHPSSCTELWIDQCEREWSRSAPISRSIKTQADDALPIHGRDLHPWPQVRVPIGLRASFNPRDHERRWRAVVPDW